jgi:hypothetical protein
VKVLNKEEALSSMYLTSLKGYLVASYAALVEKIGEPTFIWYNSDINFEWAIEYKGSIYTIYNWRSSPEDCMSAPEFQFNIGGSKDAAPFIRALQKQL